MNKHKIVSKELITKSWEQVWLLVLIAGLNILVVGSSFGIALVVEAFFQTSITFERLNLFTFTIVVLLLIFSLSNGARQKLVFDMREALGVHVLKCIMKRLLYRNQEFFDQQVPSKLYSKINYDINALKVYAHFVLNILIQGVFTLIIGLTYLLVTDLYMTIVSVAIVPLIIFSVFKIGSKVSMANQQKRSTVADLDSTVIEGLTGIQSVKLHKMEALLGKQIENHAMKVNLAARKLHFFESLISSFIILGSFSSLILVLWLGGTNVIENEMNIGQLIAFVMVLLLMSYSFASISDIHTVSTKAKTALTNLNSLIAFDLPSIENINFGINNKNISANELTFKYHPSKANCLTSVSFEFKPNKVYSIVGRSGSGKTTLVKLLGGLYQYYNGSLKIGDKEISALNSNSIPKYVSVVEQQPFFFNGTIEDNISLEPGKVDHEKLKHAIQRSCFEQVMIKNNLSLNSELTLNSSNLSGGERQRLAIARALYADADILILDEATNALDTATEKEFYSYISEIKKNRIILLISHNLDTIYLSDQVIVIADGRVAATDTPDKIIDNKFFKMISK